MGRVGDAALVLLLLAAGLGLLLLGLQAVGGPYGSRDLYASCRAQYAESGIAQSATAGKWVRHVSIDPFDDTRTILLSLEADSGESTWGDPVRLNVRLKQGELEVFINWHEYLGGGFDNSGHLVAFRLGFDDPLVSTWNYSTDHDTTFYRRYGGPNVCGFILQLAQADRFVAETTPYMEDPITAVFDVRGLAHYLPELLGN